MEPLYKNSDIAKAADSAGIIIKLGLPKYIDEKLMIEMMENCRTFVIANPPDGYETTREVVQEISNRFLHNLLEAVSKTIEYYKTVAETTEGIDYE